MRGFRRAPVRAATVSAPAMPLRPAVTARPATPPPPQAPPAAQVVQTPAATAPPATLPTTPRPGQVLTGGPRTPIPSGPRQPMPGSVLGTPGAVPGAPRPAVVPQRPMSQQPRTTPSAPPAAQMIAPGQARPLAGQERLGLLPGGRLLECGAGDALDLGLPVPRFGRHMPSYPVNNITIYDVFVIDNGDGIHYIR